VVEEDT
jgi:hypothetical protein